MDFIPRVYILDRRVWPDWQSASWLYPKEVGEETLGGNGWKSPSANHSLACIAGRETRLISGQIIIQGSKVSVARKARIGRLSFIPCQSFASSLSLILLFCFPKWKWKWKFQTRKEELNIFIGNSNFLLFQFIHPDFWRVHLRGFQIDDLSWVAKSLSGIMQTQQSIQ